MSNSTKKVEHQPIQGTFMISDRGSPYTCLLHHVKCCQDAKFSTVQLYKSSLDISVHVAADFGGLDLFGAPRTITWTHLARTAESGSDTITLETAVDWSAGEEIVITMTSFNPWETETFKISSVSEDMKSLSLNASLQYKHLCKL